MITIEQHIEQNQDAIEAEAQTYAKSYGVSIEDARRDVTDEYVQGWHEGAEVARQDPPYGYGDHSLRDV